MEDIIITLTKNQAETLRAEVGEINQLQQQLETVIRVKQASCNRYANTVIKDADHDPEERKFWQIDKRDGQDVLVLSNLPPGVVAPVGLNPEQQGDAKRAALGAGDGIVSDGIARKAGGRKR